MSLFNQLVSKEKVRIETDRNKIYEKLDYRPVPDDYSKEIEWIVQDQIANTNGMHYVDRIGKLNRYPEYELPVKKVTGNKLMLDIGAGWGRWLIGGARKGYIPVGLDLRVEFAETQQKVLKGYKQKGYSIVGDLAQIPFSYNCFDLIWSFSVIQHTHRERFINCLKGIDRTLTTSGFTKLELPNRNGIRNHLRKDWIDKVDQQDYNSWCIRYYTPGEYQKIVEPILDNFSFSNHSFLGIGVLKEDLKYVSLKNKLLCSVSLLGSALAGIIPGLKNISDSVYITATKKSAGAVNPELQNFFHAHHTQTFDNLRICPLLKCPITGGQLTLSADRTRLLSEHAGMYYPVINDIPILISSEAHPV